MPKNIFHSTVTNLLKSSKEREEKDPSWPRFTCYIILWIISLIVTRYQDDQEYNILFKQYEKHLLHAGKIERLEVNLKKLK